MISEFQAADWEPSIAKGGKFVEAVVKALYVHVGQTPPKGRKFKVDVIISQLGQLQYGSFDDTIRLTMPRACRFVYDVASNRGARHDADEIDPNAMDARVVVSTSSWILSEMIRYSQKGAVAIGEAASIVESISAKRYPLIEEVEGRVYFHHNKATAPGIALMALAHRYPKRISRDELIAIIRRHHFKATNAQMAVQRTKKFVDDDGQGNLRLLAPGLRKAEKLMGQE